MRDGWTELKLSDFCEIQQGKNLAVSQLSTGQFPVYGANGVVGFYDEYNFSQEVVALGCRGSCGTVHLVYESAWLANNVMAVWPKSENQAICGFVALLLETADLKSSGVISGQVQPQITRTSLGPLVCLLPPLVEQKWIVDVVSSVDAYSDALQQQVDLARKARNAVLHELLSAGGDDWSETTLGELCELYQPETISKAKMDDAAPYVVYGANGPVGRYSRFNHEEPEVVVTCRGATCGVVNMTPPNCWITGNAMVVKPRDNRSIKGFLFWALQTSVDVRATISGSAQPQITRAGLEPSKILVPPLVEQKRIVEIVSSMDDVIHSTEQAVADAKNLRSGLLSDLLSGEHEIPASYDVFVGAA